MVLTASTMLPLGTKAPDFNLLDTVSGQFLNLATLQSDVATVIMFICNHCPYVKLIQKPLASIAKQYHEKGIRFIAINSNDVARYPEDAPEKMQLIAQQLHYSFPYLYDEDQAIAKAYHAACTPDFYVFDKNLRCVYRGQFDDARPGNNISPTGNSVTHVLDCILANKPITSEQKPSIGCNIKWKE